MGNTLRDIADRLHMLNPVAHVIIGAALMTAAAGTALALTDNPVRRVVVELPALILGITG